MKSFTLRDAKQLFARIKLKNKFPVKKLMNVTLVKSHTDRMSYLDFNSFRNNFFI